MQLVIVRHAVAEEREVFAKTGKDDSERPLTPEGRRKFKRGARGLRVIVPSIELLATSLLFRGIETGEILQDAYRIGEAERLRELDPDASPDALVRWLGRQRRRQIIAVVGHEPHLSSLAENLLTGSRTGFIDLKKGGACLIDLGEAPRSAHGQLHWLLTASQLRQLGRGR